MKTIFEEKLSVQDIAEIKLDLLSEAKLRLVEIKIGKYRDLVKGYLILDGFEIVSVQRYDKGRLITYGDPHRNWIQKNFEFKLLEACL